MTKQISIIGCGWLGLPLAKKLVDEGYTIKGSTTSIDKIADLELFGIEAFYVELLQGQLKGDIENCLSASTVLILNIPPGLRKHPESDFVKRMSLLIPFIEKSSVEKVLFVSSTSVYGEDASFPIITEDTVPNSDTASGKQLIQVEKQLQSNSHFSTTILRFGGLFGPHRHPANYLSGRTAVQNPEAPVNLIHLDDCIGIIGRIIQKDIWNLTMNASATSNSSKKEFYTFACMALKLPIPMFEETSLSVGKRIDSEKMMRLLDFDFKVKLNN